MLFQIFLLSGNDVFSTLCVNHCFFNTNYYGLWLESLTKRLKGMSVDLSVCVPLFFVGLSTLGENDNCVISMS
jgi:hypothetical protein